MGMVKVCAKCKSTKPRGDFHVRVKKRDGLSNYCKPCEREIRRDYYRDHKEESHASNAKWKLKNQEKWKAIRHKSETRHRAKNRIRLRQWAAKNPAQYLEYVHRRRARRLGAIPKWSISFFLEEAFDLARRRTKATGIKWHVDHIVPLASPIVCGLHAHTNIAVITQAENQKKFNTWWPDMPGLD